MERRQRFIVGTVTAAITFGSLLALVNPHRFDHVGRHRFEHRGKCVGHFNNGYTKDIQEGSPPKQNITDSLSH